MENGIDLELRNTSIFQEGVKSLMANCEHHMSQSSLPSIYMVPFVMRNLSPRSFNPRLVSIGPLHKQNRKLKAFEEWKPCFLNDLLNRIDCWAKREEILELCMQKVLASMKRIKTCYVWTTKYDDVEIAKMMVMDACFILESVYWATEWATESTKSDWGINLKRATVVFDLILLENQIPFFFLDEIYNCTIFRNHPNHSLIDFIHPLIQKYFNIFNKADIKINNISVDNTHHLLSLLHQCYKPQMDVMPIFSSPKYITSAIDLDRAGVNFKPNENPPWVMEMKVRFTYFLGSWGRPTLIMPQLIITDDTLLILRNLVAFEQFGLTTGHITSYVWALDRLVNTEEDVATLVHSRVLINYMGSNQEAADIINSLGNGLVFELFFYGEQWKKLYYYYYSVWPKHLAWLKRTYFGSPWSIIALFAAIILFFLTVIQTIFTIMST